MAVTIRKKRLPTASSGGIKRARRAGRGKKVGLRKPSLHRRRI